MIPRMDENTVAVHILVARSRAAQGLSPTLTEPSALARVAALVSAPVDGADHHAHHSRELPRHAGRNIAEAEKGDGR